MKILKILGASVLVVVLLIGAVLGFAIYANESAERQAKTFCAAVPVGAAVDPVVVRAKAESVRHRGPREVDGKMFHDFEFQGWVFNAGVCRVHVSAGKVTSVKARLEGD